MLFSALQGGILDQFGGEQYGCNTGGLQYPVYQHGNTCLNVLWKYMFGCVVEPSLLLDFKQSHDDAWCDQVQTIFITCAAVIETVGMVQRQPVGIAREPTPDDFVFEVSIMLLTICFVIGVDALTSAWYIQCMSISTAMVK